MSNKFDKLAKDLAQLITRRSALFISLGALLITQPTGAEPASASISGRLVEDMTGNGVSLDDKAIPGRAVNLFRDNGDKVFNAASDVSTCLAIVSCFAAIGIPESFKCSGP